jgi:hypothetical protein
MENLGFRRTKFHGIWYLSIFRKSAGKTKVPFQSDKNTYLLNNLLTGLQLVKNFPAFYGTQRFITAFTSVRHLSLCWSSPIQSLPPHPTSWRFALILSSHLRLGLPSGLFSSGFPTKTLYTPHVKRVPVTTAWRVLRLRMEKRPLVWRVAVNILNKQSRTAGKGWSSSSGVGWGANNSSLWKRIFVTKHSETKPRNMIRTNSKKSCVYVWSILLKYSYNEKYFRQQVVEK